ncbi:DUF3995 domain-containing protein [Alkalihalobacillus sp. AL-G]|uniref:DUF3995 domain-containing protein n=1 Tax=Alkalihalobacillus sp. AL-G TaxID=2926399 RepID=UPI00272CE53E|nr:DUF3995 domain-containing protein [Alkalihalobacillus sp. AL-G]WLD94206.1 DUF3995 domain-containing protein [Alkalihalobacillus sp. AL-G]
MLEKKVNIPNFSHQLQLSRKLVLAGYAVFIWSIAYMLPHLYWALGGTVGLSLLKPSIAELSYWEMINWVASVFLTAAGLLGIAFIYLRNQMVIRCLLLAIALIGCSIATSHGIYGIFYRIFQITGVVTVESGPFIAEEHTFVWSDLLLFEPWFMIEGILLGILGWCYINKPRNRRIWLTLCTIGILIGLISGLLGVRFA